VQVDIFHGYDLRVPTTRSPTLDAEDGAERRLPYTGYRRLPYTVQGVPEPDRGRRFSLSGGRRAYAADEDKLAIRPLLQRPNEVQRELSLIVAVRVEVFLLYAELVFRHLDYAPGIRPLRNLNV